MKKKNRKTLDAQTPESDIIQNNGFENKSLADSVNGLQERIVDRLDLQLLITIIVFFVSAWAFLNSSICAFSLSANHNEVMNYMLVHYVLTVVLFLCIYITYLKGKYLVDKKALSINKDKYFSLFMNSWFWTLLICLVIIWFSTYVYWWIFVALLIGLLFYEIRTLRFDQLKRWVIMIWAVGCFPLFVSTMTIINKNIDIHFDKQYYTIDDDILISISSQGYACSHKLVNLGSKELYPNTQYVPEKNMIVLKAATVKNNRISVGTVSPASGIPNFFVYPIRRMFNKNYGYVDVNELQNERYVNYITKNINIRP